MNFWFEQIFFYLVMFGISARKTEYTLKLTRPQLGAMLQVYIIEYRDKQCMPYGQSRLDSCEEYCRHYYTYVPDLPFKNARHFNLTTKQCEPEPLCPHRIAVEYHEQEQACWDFFRGMYVDTVDAKPPSEETLSVTFICQHGKVQKFMGIKDCTCDLGYTTHLAQDFSSQSIRFKKCNHPVSIEAYFPNYLTIHYDPILDNPFPLPFDPDYWILLLQHYLRKLKYAVTTFFLPWEVEIVIMVIPQQSLLRRQDILWLVWILIAFVLVMFVTCYEMCLRTLKKKIEMMQIQ